MFDMTQFINEPASLLDMQDWANEIMRSEPHFRMGPGYMDRWFMIPKNLQQNVYLHRLLRSDEDVMHDHPWDNTSYVIAGGFIEHTPEGSIRREPGDIIHRKATDAHWLELEPGYQSISLFFTGPKIREWGFHCPKGWQHWRDFTGGYHEGRSQKGVGCGEYA